MVVKSILDTDLYKFTTSYAYMKLFPNAEGTFSFIDRDNTEYDEEFILMLNMELLNLYSLSLSIEEKDSLPLVAQTCSNIYYMGGNLYIRSGEDKSSIETESNFY